MSSRVLAQDDRVSSAGFAGAIRVRGEGLGGGRRGPLPRNYALGILIGAVAVVAYFVTRSR
jgi:hypothetical protein